MSIYGAAGFVASAAGGMASFSLGFIWASNKSIRRISCRAVHGSHCAAAGGFYECWLIAGRRAGKSFILALVACYLAVFKDWRPYLTAGELGTIRIIATDRAQAKVIFRYAKALLTQVPSIEELIVRTTDEQIELNNGIVIEIQTASFRSVRGHTIIAALLDECAFWRDETSANPDEEILTALRPAMATIPGAMLLCASSPRGAAFYGGHLRSIGAART